MQGICACESQLSADSLKLLLRKMETSQERHYYGSTNFHFQLRDTDWTRCMGLPQLYPRSREYGMCLAGVIRGSERRHVDVYCFILVTEGA